MRGSASFVARAAAVAAACAAGAGQAQERFSVDTSLAAGVAKNPVLDGGSRATGATATASITPSYQRQDALDTYSLTGNATISEYSQRNRNSNSYSVNGNASHRLSERSVISARLGYLNSVVGGFNDLILNRAGDPGSYLPPTSTTPTGDGSSAAPVVPLPILTPELPIDPTLGGIGRRRQSYTAGASIDMGLSAYDQINFDTSIAAFRAGSSTLDTFNSVTETAGYGRRINDRLLLTASLAATKIDYLGRRLNDATTLQPTVGGTYRIDAGTTLNVGVGVSVVRNVVDLAGNTDTSTPFSFQGSLCNRNDRANVCFSASRSALPSSFAGVRLSTAFSLSGQLRVSERDSFSVSASYSRSGRPLDNRLGNVLQTGPVEYLSSTGSYNRRLNARMSMFVTGGVGRVDSPVQFATREKTLELRIGVNRRFGAVR